MGVNTLTGADLKRIIEAMRYVEEKYDEIKNRFKENPFGEGKASERIIDILREKLEA